MRGRILKTSSILQGHSSAFVILAIRVMGSTLAMISMNARQEGAWQIMNVTKMLSATTV